MSVLTQAQHRRATTALELGHIYGVQRAEVKLWLQARNAGELQLDQRTTRRLTDLDAAFAATGVEVGDESVCDAIRRFEAAARRADASRAAAPLECADLDLDQAETEHAAHVKRGVRTLIARAKRLDRTNDLAELEGLRVELLSYRDTNRTWLSHADVDQLQRTAYRVELLKRTRTDTGEVSFPKIAAEFGLAPEPAASPLETLALFGTATEDRPDAATCGRCGQAFIPHSGSTRCASCDHADADQGDQLGMFEIAPTHNPKARAPRAPQPEGLF